jgi:hypothetical protein
VHVSWAAVVVLFGAGVLLLQADHAGFGWALLLLAMVIALAVAT